MRTWATRKADREWSKIQTVREIGALTVRWLDRELSRCPSYGGAPDPETFDVPEMLTTLKALNTAGLVTTQSQPGGDAIGFNGKRWVQYAAVVLFCPASLLEALEEVNDNRWMGSGLKLLTGDQRSVVTIVDGEPYTSFMPDDPWDMGLLSRTAVERLEAETIPVAIIDLVPNRNTVLWRDLDKFLAEHATH